MTRASETTFTTNFYQNVLFRSATDISIVGTKAAINVAANAINNGTMPKTPFITQTAVTGATASDSLRFADTVPSLIVAGAHPSSGPSAGLYTLLT
jgi:hypothetical protein